jgi:hypothetical protein
LSKYRSFGEHQAMEVAARLPLQPQGVERLYGEIHLLTSLRHRAGAGGATTPSSVTPFSKFFFVFFNL